MALWWLCGELIRSDLALDEYAASADERSAPTITLTLVAPSNEAAIDAASVVNAHDIDGRPFLTIARESGGYRMRAHGHGDFLITGRQVRCVPLPGTSSAAMAQLFVDRVLPNIVSGPSTAAFHASAVAFDGRAVMFVGDPGLGKSTLASAMTPPAEWLCDDAAIVRTLDNTVVVQPSYPFARMFADSLEALGKSPTERATARNDKWRFRHPRGGAPRNLSAVFALAVGETVRSEPMSLRDALAELARHLFRIDPSDRAALAEELTSLERIARGLPVYRLYYPRRYAALPAVRDAVRALVADA